jgi:hypothetical protein
MMSTRKTAFNIRVGEVASGGKMKEIKLMLSVFVLALVMLTATGASQDSWNLGPTGDWLSNDPVYHIGPFYYPNSDLSIGTQRFLNTYPGYIPLDYSNYYQTYNPIVLNRTGIYTSPSNYLQGYNNPYFYDPQEALDLAIANHAYQKSLANYYNRYYGTYPYLMGA